MVACPKLTVFSHWRELEGNGVNIGPESTGAWQLEEKEKRKSHIDTEYHIIKLEGRALAMFDAGRQIVRPRHSTAQQAISMRLKTNVGRAKKRAEKKREAQNNARGWFKMIGQGAEIWESKAWNHLPTHSDNSAIIPSTISKDGMKINRIGRNGRTKSIRLRNKMGGKKARSGYLSTRQCQRDGRKKA